MQVLNDFINNTWIKSKESETLNVVNPANQEILGKVPSGKGTQGDVEAAVVAASEAFKEWSRVPVMKRVQPLYKLKTLLEENMDDIAKTITLECGKTLKESKGELQRAIENIETACGTPMLIQSQFSENVSNGIDEFVIRQPLGVCACIVPFNFPGMISFWFLPYAVACGNTFVLKPSERVPLTMTKIFNLLEQIDLPKGVVNLVHGGKETVDAMLDHPKIKAVSFVGSTAVAKYIYSRGAANGKRVQAQGGAKNPIVILPDADVETTARIVAESAYGCAGQRCLAASNVVIVGDNHEIKDAISESARQRVTGFGLDDGVEMGPVISKESVVRVESLIDKGIREGATMVLDGRRPSITGFEQGNFVGPTILDNLPVNGELVRTEIFGPVISLIRLKTVDDALDFINSGKYGNMACIFTNDGSNARKFRSFTNAGNIGINIGVAQPLAQFPFSGWNESFFGDLHGQGRHAIEFFTQTKVVIERWFK